MCGIAGWVNSDEIIKRNDKVLNKMTKVLDKRGPDDSGIKIYDNALLGHRRLTIVDPEGGKQPMSKTYGDKKYTIVYNGELYNTEDVRKKLLAKGHKFNSYSDTEVLLVSFIEWGIDCLKEINGIFAFAIWDEKNKRLFMARDPLGVKPLFYAKRGNSIIFASEIKSLLEHPEINPLIDQKGLLEIFGLGPARSLGSGVFKDIEEVPPAYYLIYDKNGMRLNQYWELEAKEHEENLDTTTEHLKKLLIDAIERQLVSDVPVCTFLSGGLDSSAISAITANAFEREGKDRLSTFSISYRDNHKYFKVSEFQPNSDDLWVKRMADYIGSNHYDIVLDNEDLVKYLEEAVIARDLPGMADIDSSLYLFCKEVRKKATVALSGECADEIFGGYPWFRKPEDINADTFPWSKSVKQRKHILANDFKNLPIEEYVRENYLETINKVPKFKRESPQEARMRELFYLNIKWFMVNLLNRKDRMSMSNSLEVRVPFADYRLVEYAYNIPMEMKFYGNREKGLLRRALRGILPDDVIDRKKSPYPKTHHPEYTKAVQKIMMNILEDKDSPILQLIDYENVLEIVKTGGDSYKKPWFGQLMTGPQLIAFLIQVNIWMKKYKVQLI